MTAEQHRHAMADRLASAGYLTDPRWYRAFRDVPRDAFLTAFAVPGPDGRLRHHDLTDPAGTEQAMSVVYTDNSLLTQFDAHGTASSSSSAPSLMAHMLHELDPQPGQTVLEIGTGTGYNAALLCHALGDYAVTSIDIHPDLVSTATRALRRVGYKPYLDVANGRLGYPARAPYDRVIATCGLDRVPAAWPRQVRPGGRILVNLSFALVLLTVADDGAAYGRFGTNAAFMSIRDDPADVATSATEMLAEAVGPGDHGSRWVRWDDRLTAEPVAFLRALLMPALKVVTVHHQTGDELVLTDPATGSWASIRQNGDDAELTEHGPRMLYDDLTSVVRHWEQNGYPQPIRYGLTVRPDGTNILWLGDPHTVVATLR